MKDPNDDKTQDMFPADIAENKKSVKPSYLVAKANKLLTAEYSLTAIEQKILLACIAQIDSSKGAPKIALDESFRLDAMAFADIFGNRDNVYTELKEAVEKLANRWVIINNPDPEPDPKFPSPPNRTKTRWVCAIDYYDNYGCVGLMFSPKVIPYLSGLSSEFNRYKLKYVAKMTSQYGIRLYELIIQWRTRGEIEVEIGWLKKAFGIDGQYPRMYDFKKYVIEPAMDDINQYSDFWIKSGQRKTGRRVTHLQFQFSEKKQPDKLKKADLGELIHGVPKNLIDKLASPGESYESSAKRIKKLKKSKESWSDFTLRW